MMRLKLRDDEMITYHLMISFTISSVSFTISSTHNNRGQSFRTETSESNHFMYFHGGRSTDKNWKPPTGYMI